MRHLIGLLFLCSPLLHAAEIAGSPALPPFSNSKPAEWFNSAPLSSEDLHGQVLLIDFWTFDCWNCYRSFPWLNALEKRFAGEDFQVIGIHSPEFSHEKNPRKVAAKIREFKLAHPVMMDNDFTFWRAMRNRYWPAFYLIDKQGRQRFVHVGETHTGDRRAQLIETQIKQLLAE